MAPSVGHIGHWLSVEPESRVLASDLGLKRTAAAGRDAGYEEMEEGSSMKTQACTAAAAMVLLMTLREMLMMVIVEMVKRM